MKKPSIVFVLILACGLSAQAQVITVNPTELHGGTLPGSPSEYVFFTGSNYNKVGGDAAGSSKNLPDFKIIGGEAEEGHNVSYSTVLSPGGVASIPVGGIHSSNTVAVGIDLLGSISPTGLAADGFNFNDFNLYVMVDSKPGDGSYNDLSVGLDARFNNVQGTQVIFTLTSHNSSLSAADYVEYHVTGLGTAVAAAAALHPGTSNDLVLLINKTSGKNAEFSGLGFESIAAPEPSTWAMIFLGAGGLAFIARRKSAI